jgi:hypothetical protein
LRSAIGFGIGEHVIVADEEGRVLTLERPGPEQLRDGEGKVVTCIDHLRGHR